MEATFLAIAAMITATMTAAKQFIDNRKLRKWLCLKNPCVDRVKGEPPP
jgi:hypothetical protein